MLFILKILLMTGITIFSQIEHPIHAKEPQLSYPPSSQIYDLKEYPALKMIEFTLQNGMRIVLKHTEDNDISLRLVALGGYTSSSVEDRASAELAASTVIESGIGDLCTDKLSAFLYDKSIDYQLKIEPFTRVIEASFQEESTGALFTLIHQTFTNPKFSLEGFHSSKTKKKQDLLHKSTTDSLLSVINDNEKKLSPLSIKSLDQADFRKAQEFFLKAFAKPNEFLCVIVGPIDFEAFKQLCVEHLACIENKKTSFQFSLLNFEKPSSTLIKRIHNLPNGQESMIRLGLPLQIHLNSTTTEQIEVICQILESRLRNRMRSQIETKSVDIWYELPFYPSLEHPWMTIQLHVYTPFIQKNIDIVLEEVQKLIQQGLTAEEVILATQIKRQGLKLWEQDNDYWIILLSNHYLWHWDPQSIMLKFKDPQLVDFKAIQNTLKQALLLETYR